MNYSILFLFLTAVSLPASAAPNEPRAREIFQQLVEINTTDTPAGNVTQAAEAMAARLRAAGFAAGEVSVLGPAPRKKNLVVRWRGTGKRRPLLLLAHLDVVAAEPADWTLAPFRFIEKDGFFYGRGTTDDKGMASQLVATLSRLREEGFRPERDLILALTADEEGGDHNGVQWLLTHHRDLIDAELALNEGGGGTIHQGRYQSNEIQAGEKVYQDFLLEVRSPGGHSSLPVKDNPIYYLSEGLARLAKYAFPVELNELTRAYFARSAEMANEPAVAADMRLVARPKPEPAAAARLSTLLPYYNSLMRTTCVATRLHGGHAANALPQQASANVNCRILPGVAIQTVHDKLVEVLAEPRIKVSPVGTALASPPSPLLPEVMDAVQALTRQMFPGVPVIPVMGTGATDSLFLRNAGISAYGIEGTFSDIDDVRAHGKDERVGVKQYFEGLEFQYRLIKLLAGP